MGKECGEQATFPGNPCQLLKAGRHAPANGDRPPHSPTLPVKIQRLSVLISPHPPLSRKGRGQNGAAPGVGPTARVHRAPPALLQIQMDLACAVREQRRGARPADPLFRTSKKPADLAISGLCLPRQRPTFPPPHDGSIMGLGGLNFRVRDGNGCGPSGMATGNRETG